MTTQSLPIYSATALSQPQSAQHLLYQNRAKATLFRVLPNYQESHVNGVPSHFTTLDAVAPVVIISRTSFVVSSLPGLGAGGTMLDVFNQISNVDYILSQGDSVMLDADSDWYVIALNYGVADTLTEFPSVQVTYTDTDYQSVDSNSLGALVQAFNLLVPIFSPPSGANVSIWTLLDMIEADQNSPVAGGGSTTTIGAGMACNGSTSPALVTATFTELTLTTVESYAGGFGPVNHGSYIFLPQGAYSLTGQVSFAANATGRRIAGFSSIAGNNDPGAGMNLVAVELQNMPGIATAAAIIQIPEIDIAVPAGGISVSLCAFQSSGGNLSVINSPAGACYINVKEVVR